MDDSNVMSAVLQTISVTAPSGSHHLKSPARAEPVRYDDEVLESLRVLRSGDVARVRAELHKLPPMDAVQAAQVVRLLAWDQVAADARKVLTTARHRIVGLLVDHLTDPDEDFAVRRRLPRILAYSDNPRARGRVAAGLQDARFARSDFIAGVRSMR